MRYTHKQETDILKFLASHPFQYIDFGGDVWESQIIGVNYAHQNVMLRDFCEYTIDEIINSEGFTNKDIDVKWKKLIKEL